MKEPPYKPWGEDTPLEAAVSGDLAGLRRGAARLLSELGQVRYFSGGIQSNCLPACVVILDWVRMRWPDARVVIGYAGADVDPTYVAGDQAKLLGYREIGGTVPPSDFHAWIELTPAEDRDYGRPITARIFDVSGTEAGLKGTHGRGAQHIDTDAANDWHLTYRRYIVDPLEVQAFYETLKDGARHPSPQQNGQTTQPAPVAQLREGPGLTVAMRRSAGMRRAAWFVIAIATALGVLTALNKWQPFK